MDKSSAFELVLPPATAAAELRIEVAVAASIFISPFRLLFA